MNIAFEAAKLKRLLNTHGKDYIFAVQAENEFKEKHSSSSVLSIRGVYHETNSDAYIRNTEATRVQKKPTPRILTLWEHIAGLSVDDTTVINGKTYKVSGINNIQEQNAIADISLEVVL